jgi:hypothetical protein
MRISIRPKILDIVIFLVALSAVVATSLIIFSDSGSQLYAEINGKTGEWIESIDSHKEILVPGPLGVTHVHIEDEKVWIDDSPCDNKLCIAMGKIWLVHQWVACLPNEVFVRIRGRNKGGDELDASTF